MYGSSAVPMATEGRLNRSKRLAKCNASRERLLTCHVIPGTNESASCLFPRSQKSPDHLHQPLNIPPCPSYNETPPSSSPLALRYVLATPLNRTYRRLMIQIPQLGFGVYQSPPEIVDRSVLAALEAGYRHIDSAQWYFNEEEVGKAVSSSSVPRDQVFLTTKLGHKDKIQERLDESVAKINGEGGYVDLFLIHAPTAGVEGRKEQWGYMEGLIKSGKAKAIGVSN
jgi:hypothetical protein